MTRSAKLLSLGAALLIAAAPGCGERGSGDAARTLTYDHVVLVTIDTLRADHLGSYGYPRKPSNVAQANGDRFFDQACASQ